MRSSNAVAAGSGTAAMQWDTVWLCQHLRSGLYFRFCLDGDRTAYIAASAADFQIATNSLSNVERKPISKHVTGFVDRYDMR